MKKLVFILFLALMGCQSAEPISPAAVASDANHDPFSVRLSLPEQVKVNEQFTMEAELKNKSDRAFEIMTGEPLFFYVIRDSDGNSDPILRTDIGVVRPLGPNKAILEKYPYRFKNPGVYEITAVAEFTLQGEDDNNQVYKIETDPKKIEVIE
ncbi:hypothetical protein NYE70_12075 [Paenibacillus sp. FSL R5-0407]|uniref:hypothetical protein n=1 Tax=Paenibacillus sp. FSL R5-0407 TaxID=2975320 RepID=UPI0030F941B5